MNVVIRTATQTEWIATLADRESLAMTRYEHPDRTPRTDAQEIDWWNDRVATKQFRIWSILYTSGAVSHPKSDHVENVLVGFINAFDFKPKACETGVQIFEPFWRLGIASAAYPKVLAVLKAELGFSETWIGTHPDNSPALKLFEKLGYQLDGTMDDPPIQWTKMTIKL